MFKKVLKTIKGIVKGAVNVATGGILDRIREGKIINELDDIKNDKHSATPLYMLLDMLDDGTLNNSFDPARAENAGKAIGGIVVAIVLAWNFLFGG